MQPDLMDHIQQVSSSFSRVADHQARNAERAKDERENFCEMIRAEIATTLKYILLHPSTQTED